MAAGGSRPRVAALLRGINIGPHKRISMPVLRAIVEGLGHEDVETYVQSGNVVFRPAHKGTARLETEIAAAISDETGHDVGVVIRSGRELGDVVASTPYDVTDPTRLVVAFFGDTIDLESLGLDDLASYAPDELTMSGRHAYISVPNGQGRSKLMAELVKRRLPTVVTVRNWRTVTMLADLTR